MDDAFTGLHLLHDRGETPMDGLDRLRRLIQEQCPTIEIYRPNVLHADTSVSTEKSYLWLAGKYLPQIKANSLLVGIGLSGLLASRLQERFPEMNLSVIAINSPTQDDGLRLEEKLPNRIAAFSQAFRPIIGRTNWDEFAEAYNLLWLQHGAYLHTYVLRNAIVAYLKGEDIGEKLNSVLPPARE